MPIAVASAMYILLLLLVCVSFTIIGTLITGEDAFQIARDPTVRDQYALTIACLRSSDSAIITYNTQHHNNVNESVTSFSITVGRCGNWLGVRQLKAS